MLTFLMVALIVFFVTSGVFLSIEARIRSQMETAKLAASSGKSASDRDPVQAVVSDEPKMPKAA